MQHTDPTALVLARLAAAERALAARSAEAALARGVRRATPWWEAPRECVAMLSRHAGVAEVVTAALGGTSSAEWAARLPDLTGCATTTLRDARAAWLDALRALARGETVTVPPIPSPDRAPPDPVLPAAAPAEPPEALPPVTASGAPPRAPRDLRPERSAARLSAYLRRIADPAPTAEPDPDDTPEAPASRVWWEVSARGDGALGLHLVAAPTDGFAPFVKSLTLSGAGWRQGIRRDNLARLGARIEVPPGAAPLVWTTGDPDDDAAYAALLASLTPPALPTERATVFRCEVSGATQRLEGAVLSPGRNYAVVLPPSLSPGPAEGLRALDGGWSLWTVALPAVPTEAQLAQLAAVGLGLGAVGLDAAWVLTPPRRWDITPRGERVAVFDPNDTPVVQVSSPVPRHDLVLQVWGDGALTTRRLATTDRVEVCLPPGSPGRYVLEVTADDPAVAPVRLVWDVEPGAKGRWRVEAPTVRLGDTVLAPDTACVYDLSMLGEALPWTITAPPAMSLRVQWQGATTWDSGWLAADEDGSVALEGAIAATGPHRHAAPLGALSIDLGEWGVVRVVHVRTAVAAVTSARSALRRAMEGAAVLHAQTALDPELARMLWAQPVAEALGYTCRSLHAGGLPAAALETVAHEGAWRVTTKAVLALVRPGVSLRERDADDARTTLNALGHAAGVTRALVSDGRRWWDLDLTRSAAPLPDALDAVLDDDDGLEGFLARYGAWR